MLLLWVPWKSPSENEVRAQHWTANRKANIAAKEAWVRSLKSSPAAIASLTTIIRALGANRLETPSPEASVLTTETSGCAGATDSAGQTEKKEQSLGSVFVKPPTQRTADTSACAPASPADTSASGAA